MTSDFRVGRGYRHGRGFKIAPQIGRYREGQNRYVVSRSRMVKKRRTSLMNDHYILTAD